MDAILEQLLRMFGHGLVENGMVNEGQLAAGAGAIVTLLVLGLGILVKVLSKGKFNPAQPVEKAEAVKPRGGINKGFALGELLAVLVCFVLAVVVDPQAMLMAIFGTLGLAVIVAGWQVKSNRWVGLIAGAVCFACFGVVAAFGSPERPFDIHAERPLPVNLGGQWYKVIEPEDPASFRVRLIKSARLAKFDWKLRNEAGEIAPHITRWEFKMGAAW